MQFKKISRKCHQWDTIRDLIPSSNKSQEGRAQLAMPMDLRLKDTREKDLAQVREKHF